MVSRTRDSRFVFAGEPFCRRRLIPCWEQRTRKVPTLHPIRSEITAGLSPCCTKLAICESTTGENLVGRVDMAGPPRSIRPP
jgi:hypothetical protein